MANPPGPNSGLVFAFRVWLWCLAAVLVHGCVYVLDREVRVTLHCAQVVSGSTRPHVNHTWDVSPRPCLYRQTTLLFLPVLWDISNFNLRLHVYLRHYTLTSPEWLTEWPTTPLHPGAGRQGLPVQMHGQPDTAAQLEELLAEFRDDYCTQVRAKLVSYASTNAPCADSVEYDMHVGLLELIKIFAARNPSTDLMLPEVRQSKCVVCMMHIPILTARTLGNGRVLGLPAHLLQGQ